MSSLGYAYLSHPDGYNNGPKPLDIAKKDMSLHIFGVQLVQCVYATMGYWTLKFPIRTLLRVD